MVGTGVAVGSALVKMASNSAEAADVVDKGAQRMNISTDSFQELAHAASLSGVEMSTLEKAAKKLEGTDLNLDQALEEIYALGTAEERSAKAAELFGESVAYTMSPMLNASAEDMAAMRQEAHDLGIVMSEDSVTAGAKLSDTLENIHAAFTGIVTNLGASLMPLVQQFGDFLLQLMPSIQDAMALIAPLLGQLFETLMPPLMQLVQMLLPVLTDVLLPTLVNLLNAIMPILNPIMQILNPIINLLMTLLTPLLDLINLILPPIIELGTKLATLLADTIGIAVDKAIKFFNNFRDKVKVIFEQVRDFIKKPINSVIGFINGLIRGIVGGVNGVIRALNRFQIKVPNWLSKITGIQTFGFNLAEVSAPQIPLLAEGGDITAEGSAIVGERAPELVELPRGARVSPLGENISDKLDAMINMMADFIRTFQGLGVYINGGALVGQIAPQMDRELGRMSVRAERWA